MAGPGPIYDNALRLLAASDLAALCRWLGIDADEQSIRVSEALPATTQYVDLLAETGTDHLAHVEFVHGDGRDLGVRMVGYRARIMRQHTGRSLRQHVLVLGRANVPRVVRDGDEFALRLHVTYVRDHDPVELLTTPSLAPLAPLGRAVDATQRRWVLGEALSVIKRDAEPARRQELAAVAATLASVYLAADSIDAAWKEAAMPLDIINTPLGQKLAAEGRAKGHAQGLAEGHAEGRRELLGALLRSRFGHDERIAGVVDRLLELPDRAVVAAMLDAHTVEELDERVAQLPHRGA